MRIVPTLVVALVVLILAAGCAGTNGTTSEPEMRTLSGIPTKATGLPPGESGSEGQATESTTTSTPPAVPPDAIAMGPLAWMRHHYDLGYIIVEDAQMQPYQYPVPINGSVVVPEGAGPFPVLVFLHGRHVTCDVPGVASVPLLGVCPELGVIEPVNSYQGYDYLAENLASHGYVVASINANTINDRDLLGDSGANARAQLILKTLEELQSLHATGEPAGELTGLPQDAGALGPALKGHLDLSRIGLMGHSRGGEGVTRVITMNQERAEPFAIQAVFALAPTDFGLWKAPNVAFATLLPYCDGDVSNLQGSWIYDESRDIPEDKPSPRFQLLAMGSNHNFYNTIWTGDDWGETGEWCGLTAAGNGRDSPEAQRLHGLHFMASFLRLFVGGEGQFAPTWYDGSWPADLCPGDKAPCPERFLVSVDPAGGDKAVLSRNGKPTASNAANEVCDPPFCPAQPTYSFVQQTTITVTGSATVRYDAAPGTKLAGMRYASLRAGTSTTDGALDVAVHVVGNGGEATVALPPILPPPGGDNSKTVLSEYRADLTGLVLGDELVALDFVFTGTAKVQVADVQVRH